MSKGYDYIYGDLVNRGLTAIDVHDAEVVKKQFSYKISLMFSFSYADWSNVKLDQQWL